MAGHPKVTAAAASIDGYLARSYDIELRRNADGSYFAHVPDLPGCMTEGETAAEALRAIDDAMRAWITVAVEDGRQVPLPRGDDDYSGRFVVRVPSSLHRDLAVTARREGVSLNTFVVATLSRALGGTS